MTETQKHRMILPEMPGKRPQQKSNNSVPINIRGSRKGHLPSSIFVPSQIICSDAGGWGDKIEARVILSKLLSGNQVIVI